MVLERKLSPRGFTLVEMAMVMVIMGLVMLTVFPALSMMRAASSRAATQSNLNALMTATAAYVQANGCLPCPTPPNISNTNPSGFGRVRGDASAAPAACSANVSACAPEGLPPYVSLGLPASTARDGYGHWISMRVDPLLTTSFGIVPPTAPCSCAQNGNTCTPSSPICSCSLVSNVCEVSPLQANQSIQGLCQSNLRLTATNNPNPNASPIKVFAPGSTNATFAAVLFISYGANGYGSFQAYTYRDTNNGNRLSFPPTTPACSPPGIVAQCNDAGTGVFYDELPVDDETGAQTFDDMLAFADRNTLVSRFGNGSCQTVW